MCTHYHRHYIYYATSGGSFTGVMCIDKILAIAYPGQNASYYNISGQ
eukprot:gene9997-18919_t